MKYESPSAFRIALERRLLTQSRESGTPLSRVRKLVVFDRLLARLLIAAPDRWLLKGALALDYRLEGRFRTTKDLDLSRLTDISDDAIVRDFLAAQTIQLNDYFSFVVQRVDHDGSTSRMRANAGLAGRRFETVTVDVGLNDPLFSSPELVRGPDLLGFAALEPIAIPTLPLEQHIAEKVHANTRIYPGQRQGSRVKDLVDLVVMQSHSGFEAAKLRTALDLIFIHRDTHALPTHFPESPQDWRTAYRRLAIEVGIDPDVRAGHHLVSAFLDPVLDEVVTGNEIWDTERARWNAPGSGSYRYS